MSQPNVSLYVKDYSTFTAEKGPFYIFSSAPNTNGSGKIPSPVAVTLLNASIEYSSSKPTETRTFNFNKPAMMDEIEGLSWVSASVCSHYSRLQQEFERFCEQNVAGLEDETGIQGCINDFVNCLSY